MRDVKKEGSKRRRQESYEISCDNKFTLGSGAHRECIKRARKGKGKIHSVESRAASDEHQHKKRQSRKRKVKGGGTYTDD